MTTRRSLVLATLTAIALAAGVGPLGACPPGTPAWACGLVGVPKITQVPPHASAAEVLAATLEYENWLSTPSYYGMLKIQHAAGKVPGQCSDIQITVGHQEFTSTVQPPWLKLQPHFVPDAAPVSAAGGNIQKECSYQVGLTPGKVAWIEIHSASDNGCHLFNGFVLPFEYWGVRTGPTPWNPDVYCYAQ